MVVGGAISSTGARPVTARLLANGTLDEGFGVFGKQAYDLGGDASTFTGVTLQGTQIIAGGVVVVGTNQDDLVARLQVDLTFANGFE